MEEDVNKEDLHEVVKMNQRKEEKRENNNNNNGDSGEKFPIS